MSRISRISLLIIVFCSFVYNGQIWAQQDTSVPLQVSISGQKPIPARHKIAIFAPLYLDSAFDGYNTYRYDKSFPKFINPGLEFYEGIQFALDSLDKEGANLEVFVYDTRSARETLEQQLSKPELKDVEMIIAHATIQENRIFADAARARRIPYINPNLPNDGGIRDNPYFVLLNSTLKTHIDGLYKFVQRYYSLGRPIVFRKKGQMEDMIQTFLDDAGKNTAGVPLRLSYVDLPSNFDINNFLPHMDSSRHMVIIIGTLDEQFSRRLITVLSNVSRSYPMTIIGMPTLENLSREFDEEEYKGPEIIYSTPFYNPRSDKVSNRITNYFNATMFARPSDMVMRGYEAAWRFGKLLIQYKSDLTSNLTRKEYNVFREFDIQPVINRQTSTLDYFENKKLYFIKWQDGAIKAVL